MPNIQDAITGQDDLHRKRIKAQRTAKEGFQNIPAWARNWTPEEMETYVNEQVTDLTSAKLVISKLAWMCGALRDYMLLKQEGD